MNGRIPYTEENASTLPINEYWTKIKNEPLTVAEEVLARKDTEIETNGSTGTVRKRQNKKMIGR